MSYTQDTGCVHSEGDVFAQGGGVSLAGGGGGGC